jgi:hypothetical protein
MIVPFLFLSLSHNLKLLTTSMTDPPSFLFDAIPEGISRRVAGFLLWGHVAVSYAINSQALCSSIDRFLVSRHSTTIFQTMAAPDISCGGIFLLGLECHSIL